MRSNVTFKKSLLALAIVQASAMSSMALAEDTIVLDELKVEGRAITELDQEITAEDIEKTQATDLEGLFRSKSEVTAGGSVKIGQKIYVRNIGEDSLNITIDGAEQSGGVFHHAGRITIEPELVKRVEIEAGAANATSGPGALGGSVRFITKDASDLLNDNQNVGALLKSTYSSNGSSIKNSATVYGRTESGKTEGMLHLTNSSHDNYEDGNGDEIDGTELDETLGFAKIQTQLNDKQTLTISHENLTE
ncbi:TonB-dependent receptor plug domain-containing protein, partial [Marinomonas sp.]